MQRPTASQPSPACRSRGRPLTTPTRTLDLAAADKPLDIGNGIIAASIGRTGQIQALSGVHRTHGSIVLSTDVAFDDDRRFDVSAVRRHRRGLADPDGPGITISTPGAWQALEAALLADAVPRLRLAMGPVRATVTTWAPLEPSVAGVVQTWDLHNTARQPTHVAGRVTGLGQLTRASLTQLTEGGILPAPDPSTTLAVDAGVVVVEAPALPAVALLHVQLRRGSTSGTRTPVPEIELTMAPDEQAQVVLRISLGETRPQAHRALTALSPDSLEPTLARWMDTTGATLTSLPGVADTQAERLVTRAINYATGACTAVVDNTTCVLTDHRILPLTWTRDAYWTCTALAETHAGGAADLIRRHLAWLFDVAERPDGWWARSYLPSGAIKDPAHQLDQQCYPLLEAIDHAQRSHDAATLRRHADTIGDVASRLLAQRHPTGLLATDETPADDPLDLPFHLSSNLLAAHTFRRLADVADTVDLDRPALTEAASRTLAAITEHLTIEVDGQGCLAYATDLSTSRWYHDANDVPTVLAPRWGLDIPLDLWEATLEMAFSPANVHGFAPGPMGGLGSVHTPGAWPLGDAQELMFAAWTGDRPRSTRVLTRLATTASWDGSLPECRDPDTGAVRSRHWFAWPGCLLALALQMLADPGAGTW